MIGALGALVRARGVARLLEAPMLRATPEHFPDTWSEDRAGATAMIRRVLLHAGIREPVQVRMYSEARRHELSQPSPPPATEHEGTTAWYAGHDGDALEFGVEREGLKDPESLVGTLCHEAAHAFRDAHGLVTEDRALEERLTDVTTIYLGFGGVRSVLGRTQAACFTSAWEVLSRRPFLFEDLGLPEALAQQRRAQLRAHVRRVAAGAVLLLGGAVASLLALRGLPVHAAVTGVVALATVAGLWRSAGRRASAFVSPDDPRVAHAVRPLDAGANAAQDRRHLN